MSAYRTFNIPLFKWSYMLDRYSAIDALKNRTFLQPNLLQPFEYRLVMNGRDPNTAHCKARIIQNRTF